MKDVILRMNLAGYANKVRFYTNRVKENMAWLQDNLPMEKDLKEVGRLMYDSNGEVFLYYDGIYYSWKIIISILKENDMVTIDSLYDKQVNK